MMAMDYNQYFWENLKGIRDSPLHSHYYEILTWYFGDRGSGAITVTAYLHQHLVLGIGIKHHPCKIDCTERADVIDKYPEMVAPLLSKLSGNFESSLYLMCNLGLHHLCKATKWR